MSQIAREFDLITTTSNQMIFTPSEHRVELKIERNIG